MKSRFLFTVVVLLFMHLRAGAQLTYETLRVEYDSAWTFRNLQLIPVRFKAPGAKPVAEKSGPKYISLPEAIEKGKVKVREMQSKDGASVNSLEMVNTSKDYVLVNSGELLAGGKQDRMISETRILPPGKETSYVDVFCIEKGRWDAKPKGFKNNGKADYSLKKVMDVSGRQSEVWKEIQRQFSSENKVSETWPYLALQRNKLPVDPDYVKFFTSMYKASDSLFAGFVAITGNRIISCELFASTDMTNLSFGSMLQGFISQAVKAGSPPVMKREATRQFMDKLLENETTQKAFVAGRGKIDRHEGKVIHIVVYGD